MWGRHRSTTSQATGVDGTQIFWGYRPSCKPRFGVSAVFSTSTAAPGADASWGPASKTPVAFSTTRCSATTDCDAAAAKTLIADCALREVTPDWEAAALRESDAVGGPEATLGAALDCKPIRVRLELMP